MDGGYRYQPLQQELNQIRILTLLPGAWDETIECRLSTRSLDDSPAYATLSYPWGTADSIDPIAIDNGAVGVTGNLYSVLRYLRKPDEPLDLWVDALCINQRDEIEKSHQIALMGRIYRQCAAVYIWLGDGQQPVQSSKEDPEVRRALTKRLRRYNRLASLCSCFMSSNVQRRAQDYKHFLEEGGTATDNPFALIEHFASDRHVYELPCCYHTILFGKLKYAPTLAFRTMWDWFVTLLHSPWHSRFWCVQEALLPPSGIVLFGHRQIPWDVVKKGLQNWGRHLATCCHSAEKQLPDTLVFFPDRLYMDSTFPGNPEIGKDVKVAYSLEVLLRLYRYKDSRDPRDKVYGILGLIPESVAPIEADYALTTKEVYKNAIGVTMSQDPHGLRFLTGEGFGSSNHGLPSWVRDLSIRPNIGSIEFEMRRYQHYDFYNASGTEFSGPFIHDNDHLRVKGILIDQIKHICLPMCDFTENKGWPALRIVLEDWLKATNLRRYVLLPKLTKTAQVRWKKFWQTLIGGLVYDRTTAPKRMTEEEWRNMESWLRQTRSAWLTGLTPSRRDRYLEPFLSACAGRAFFVTEYGHYGLCYPTARVGDEVVVLEGGNVPFVLRQGDGEGDGNGDGGRRKLVGDCYLNGFMDGEVLESGDVRFRDIVLG